MSEHLQILPTNENKPSTAPAAASTDSVFLCRKCWELYQIETDDPTVELNEFSCPDCQTKLQAEPYRGWMRGLCAAQNSEKPRQISPEGRERLREAGRKPHNRGPQTPEDKFRISANSRKHGAYAKQHILPRAAHGKLAACKTCPFASPEENPQGDGRCIQQGWTACAAQAPEIFAFYAARAGQGNDALKEIIGGTLAQQVFLLNMSLREIFRDGIVIEETIEKDFGEKGSSTETRYKLNPAVEASAIFSRNLGGANLIDFQLTPKSSGDQKLAESLTETLELMTGRKISPLASAAAALAITEKSES